MLNSIPGNSLGLVVLAFWLLGCEIKNTPENVDISECYASQRGTVSQSAKIVRLSGGRDQEHILPVQIELFAGEPLRIVSLDHRVHSVSFVKEFLSFEMEKFLSTTEQLVLPPLLVQGSCLNLDFTDAPSGEYVFLSQSHGQPVFGKIIIR